MLSTSPIMTAAVQPGWMPSSKSSTPTVAGTIVSATVRGAVEVLTGALVMAVLWKAKASRPAAPIVPASARLNQVKYGASMARAATGTVP